MKLNLSWSSLVIPLEDLIKIKQPIYRNKKHIEEAIKWLIRAQSVSKNGGVSSGYSLSKGWLFENIETTGYIMSTFLEASLFLNDMGLQKKAQKMADFLVSSQLPNGGFQTYPLSIKSKPMPTIFNTGQDLIGMTDIYKATRNKIYLESMIKAANFLVKHQEKDGYWKKYSYDGKPHSYDSRVALSLLKTYMETKDKKFLSAARNNLEWVISLQSGNGWFDKAELPYPNPTEPYSHTLAYVIEGLLLSGILFKENKYINFAKKTADKIMNYYQQNKYLPGTFDNSWKSSDNYSCLTGNAQVSGIWLRLYYLTKDKKYYSAAKRLNYSLKNTQNNQRNDLNIRGGIKGSQPVFGDVLRMRGYCRMTYLNWATKYFVDALILEELVAMNKKPLYI